MIIAAGANVLNVTMTVIVTQSTLSGVVGDVAGYPISGVTVAISSQAGGVITQTQTNSLGEYAFGSLTPGTYIITFTKQGYNTETR